MARLLVLANEATAAQRRVYFHLVDATDGLTAETGEAGGQPQVSSDGGAWTNTGIGTLNAIGNGRYYADLTQTLVQTTGTLIETRYKSANTAECPGDSVQVVAFDPNDAQLGMSARLLGTTTVTNLNTIFDTDYADVYNTTGKCLLVQLSNVVTHGGSEAKLQLGSTTSTPALLVANSGGDAVQFTSSGGNGDALQLAAHGTGSAIVATGGATGHGASFVGGATSGNGILATGTAGNSAAMSLVGQGSAAGLLSTGGATGDGIRAVGGATSGDGIDCLATTSGAGLRATGAGNIAGISTTGNGTASGLLAQGGATGSGIFASGGATSGYGMICNGAGAFAGLAVAGGDTGVGVLIVGGGTSGDGVSISTTSGHGVNIAPVGTAKHGVQIAGGNGATADGINVSAGTGGVAIRSASTTVTGATTYTGNVSMAAGLTVAQSSLNSPAILVTGNGTAAGVDVTGGATGDGITVAAGGGSGRALHLGSITVDGTSVLTGAVSMGSTFTVTGGIVANMTGNITGNLVGTVSTLTTYTGNTPQTGDCYARLGAPAGASVSADVAAIQADLPQRFTKNTALAGFQFFMRDTADHVTGKTGLTITATRSLDGAAFASCTNSATEIGNGWYKIDLAAGDLNGNAVALRFTGTGADSTNLTVITQPT